MGLEGSQIDRYQVLHLLGSGAMGDVYLAEDPRIGQQVAIKVIRIEPGLYPDVLNAQEAARLFQREIQAIVKLDSPHILPLYDYGEQPVGEMNIIYLVMPYRKEGSLAKWLSQRKAAEPLSPQEVADFVGQVAEALQHAHNRQIIHRDVKPSNILLRLHEETPNRPDMLLADFGIAQLMTTTSNISQSIRGTPTYMAPEQWAGEAGPASDQYALAIMTYELLTGQPPFRGAALQVMYQHMNNQPLAPGMQNPRLSREIDQVLLRALAKKADERFASVSAFARAFQEAANALSGMEQDIATVLKSSPSEAVNVVSDGESDISTVVKNPSTEALNALSDVEQDISTVLKSPSPEELRVVLAISEAEAQTGTVRTIMLPGGRAVMVTLPAGIQHGSVIRLGEQNSDAKDLAGTVLLSIMIKQETEALPVSDDSATALLPDKRASTDPTTMLSDKQAPTVSTVVLQDQVPVAGSQQSSVAPPEPDTDKILMLSSAAETSEEERGNLKGVPQPPGPPLAPTQRKWSVRGWGNLKGLSQPLGVSLAPMQRTKRRMLLAIGLVILVLLLIGGSIFIVSGYLSPSVHDSSSGSSLMGGSTPMTVVTITPAQKELQHTYMILAVTGTPDSAKQQVAARQLTSVTAPQSQTAQATGISTTPATHASGTLTLYNYSTTSPLTLNAGMEIANMQSTSVDMILDAAVTAPPGQDASNPGTANVPAHVAQVGPIGNLPPVNNGDAGFYSCTNCPNGNVSGYEIENDAAFSGGQNGQTVTTVQQSDIDNAANTLASANEPNAQQILQTQIRTNERLINAAQCKPNVSSNHAAGEQASSVTVTVTFTCTGEVYDQSAALALAQQLLVNQAKGQFGPRYTLRGSITASVTRAVLTDAGRGTITLTVNTSGTWVAHFDNTSLQALAVLLAGKTKQEAQAILLANKDIARADIEISGGNGDVLSTDVHQIRIVANSYY